MYEYLVTPIEWLKRVRWPRASLNSTNPVQIIKKRPFLFMASLFRLYPEISTAGKT